MGKKRPGRPRKKANEAKGQLLQVRIEDAEKAAFAEAARLAGLGLSGWVRERLRRAARRELEEAGHDVPFLATQGPKKDL